MIKKTDKLVEATMLALQGKLELKENRTSRRSRKTRKSEGIDVNVDDNTTVSVEGNETIVDTQDATVIVNKKEDTFVPETSDDVPMEAPVEEPTVDAPVAPDDDMVEVPADDTVMPEEVVDEPIDTELPTEENKRIKTEGNKIPRNWSKITYKAKIDTNLDKVGDIIEITKDKYGDTIMTNTRTGVNAHINWSIIRSPEMAEILKIETTDKKVEDVNIEVSDDGKEVEVTTDNGEEVEVKNETPDENKEGEIEDTETEVPADDEPSIDEMIEESKKVTEGARDIADHINNDEWFNNDKRKQTLRGMLADKIADVAESLGDDYSEWVSDMDFDDIINDIINSKEWEAFDEKLNEIIAEAVEDKVDWTRRDEPASRYYTGNPDLKESKKVEDSEEYLEPRYDSRASFYKKAKVVTKDNGDEELYSYGTHVGGVRGGKPYSKGRFSQTTSRHQKEFFKQRGIDPKKVDVEEGKQADRNEEEIKAKRCSNCIKHENKARSKKVQEMIARRQRKSEALNNLNKTVKRHRAVLEHKKVQEAKYEDMDKYPEEIVDEFCKGITTGKIKKSQSFTEWVKYAYPEIHNEIEFGLEESKKVEAKNDLCINSEIPKKEEPVPNTAEASLKVESKFSSKSFNEALTKYYKDKIIAVESVEVTKLSKTRTGLKIEANLKNKSGKLKRAICLEMKQIQTGKSFDKYELIETKGLVKENKANSNKVTMTTFTNKNHIIECRYILSK